MNSGFLRDPLTARVPDAVVPFALLMAWVSAQAWNAWPRVSPTLWLLRGTAVAVLLFVAAAAATIGRLEETLDRAELLPRSQDLDLRGLRDPRRLLPRPGLKWRDVSAQLREPFAERQVPTASQLTVVTARHASSCTVR